MGKLIICTPHFNPSGYNSLRDNFYKWREWLDQFDVDLRPYELVFDDDEPQIEGSEVIYGTREKHLMFQKEALINIGIKDAINDGAEYFAWIDHDIIIKENNWVDNSISLLQDFDAVQLFERMSYTGKTGNFSHDIRSVCTGCRGAPGGAWMAKTNTLKRLDGIPDNNIIGYSDQTFACAVLPWYNIYKSFYPPIRDSDHKYVSRARKMGLKATYLKSGALHLYHGSLSNRRYDVRGNILVRGNFCPNTDIVKNKDGIYEWCSNKPEMHREVREYFDGRKEDE